MKFLAKLKAGKTIIKESLSEFLESGVNFSIHKSGEKKTPNNLRGATLSNSLCKIYFMSTTSWIS